jgi:zinc protease
MTKLALRPPVLAVAAVRTAGPHRSLGSLKLAVLVCSLGLAIASPAVAQRSTAVQVPKLKLTDFTLPNGLRVLMHEDHSSPIVAVDMWYNAGSKFDPRGKTGLAHMFEHMLDEGSLNMPAGEYKRLIQQAGGGYNASTQNDFARYNTVVPSNYLETVLWLEAERMANLTPALERFNLEREAVRNEYRQRILNDPSLSAATALIQTLFPEGAYAPPLYGYPADLASITLEDMRPFYDTYYVPNNAALVIIGDFNTADARKQVVKHFGAIPRGKPVKFPEVGAPLRGEKRIVTEHPAGIRGVWAAWRGAKSSSPDRAAILALASIVSQRLSRIFAQERRVGAMSPYSAAFDLAEAGIFQIAMTPNATASATMFEEVMDSVITAIKTDGVSESEVRRWVGSYRMQTLTDMQSVASIASNIGDATLGQKRPLAVYEMLDRAQRVTPAEVQAAAKKYLTGDRVIVSIVPTGKLDLISKPNLPYVIATPK